MHDDGDELRATPRPENNFRPPSLTRRRRRVLPLALAVVLVGGFALVAWYALAPRTPRGPAGSVPLVTADSAPVKEKPEDPGGMRIPNQDKLVYERLTPVPPQEGEDKLAPAPEQPVARPQAETVPPPAAPSASGDEDKTADATASAGTQPAASDTEAAPKAQPAEPKQVAATEAPAKEEVKPEKPDMPAPTEAAKPVEPKPEAPAKQPAPATKPAPTKTAKASAGTWRIQLAAFRDEAAAKKAWGALSKKYAGILSGLQPRYQRVDITGKGVFYRLQAGPMANETAARNTCDELAARKQGCLLVRP